MHLLTGVRNVHEALVDYRLTTGNRIGHGIALGIDPESWCDQVGRAAVTVEDRLLDLVWADARKRHY